MKDSSVTMDTGGDFDREGLMVPRKSNMVFKISLLPMKFSKE